MVARPSRAKARGLFLCYGGTEYVGTGVIDPSLWWSEPLSSLELRGRWTVEMPKNDKLRARYACAMQESYGNRTNRTNREPTDNQQANGLAPE
jgi:hypothetical protein